MRDSKQQKQTSGGGTPTPSKLVAADERRFFDSFYTATVTGTPTDRMTIGAISEMESRFHYNVTENSMIRALSRIEPPPAGEMLRAWTLLQSRRRLRLLDVGTATGHWIDFMVETFLVAEAVAVELTEVMCDFLRKKYEGRDVAVLNRDAADEGFSVDDVGGPVDYITAIGVIFHILDDARWECAVSNLAGALKPGGIMLIGGEFGTKTENVETMATDTFTTWKECDSTEAAQPVVTKRVRSLSRWTRVAIANGLDVVDLVRSDRDPVLSTPENDILVLQKSRGE